ncbi:hypothetical protein AAVH_37278 [Aphelenchoides avenae]|nr:hypothetical protein AAVH_37278 [Aphelenchus avenae]
MYQSCTNIHKTLLDAQDDNPDDHCGPYRQKNGFTGDFTCPEQYDAVPITSKVIELADDNFKHSGGDCDYYADFWLVCDDDPHYFTLKVYVRIETYWCRLRSGAVAPENTGEMFGGLYRNGDANPFTGRSGCPASYLPYKLGFDTTVCLSRDYQLGHEYSVDFAGFFSCLTPESKRKCATGYSQHFATSVESCDIYYCVRPTTFKALIPRTIRRPPYTPYWVMMSNTSVSTVQGYINNNKWLEMPLSTAYTLAKGYVSKLPPSIGRYPMVNVSDPKAVIDKWIRDKRKEVAMILKKNPHGQAPNHRSEL